MMRAYIWLYATGLAVMLAACSPGAAAVPSTPFTGTVEIGTAEASSTTSISPTPVTYAAPPGGPGPTELRYRVLQEFPDFFFCDPDYYPVARADEMELARQSFPELQASTEEFTAILAHNNLSALTSFSSDQQLLIYQEHKRLAALFFEPNETGYQFQLQVAGDGGEAELILGEIDMEGTITVQLRQPTVATCPICLALGTWIDTPMGPVAVEDLHPGQSVWTMDPSGRRVAAPVVRVGATVVPASHEAMHLVLDDGRELHVSPGHPTADGAPIGHLLNGDTLDGAVIVSAALYPYLDAATYDLLPAGDTGFYWANGILMGSTLWESP